MFLLQLAKILAVASLCQAANTDRSKEETDDSMPFDYFLGPHAQELARERPIAFNPDEGHNFRKEYESKYGYRGERLIAQLGGGAAPPLSFFDASRPSETTTHAPSSSSAPGDAETSETSTTASTPTEEEHRQQYKPQRKYVYIDRKPKGFLNENFFENNIPQETSYKTSPDGVVYKRLYGAIWNHGANGLARKPGFDQGMAGLGAFMPLGWDAFNFNNNPTANFPALFPLAQQQQQLQEPFHLPLQIEQPDNEGQQTQSQKEFAGLGEPSIMVKSYSYR